MEFKEKLTWILDKKGCKANENFYQENIDFVHSLHKKCDCVGWSELDMNEPDANEVLEKIRVFCKQNGWNARCLYERTYTDITSDWYELKTDDFKENTIADIFTITSESGKEIYLQTINAYRELNISPKEHWINICVPDKFRKACIKNNITDIDFCWVQDKGKYKAEQYFCVFPHKSLSRIACDKGLKHRNVLKLKRLGGYLPKIASIFKNIQTISLQDCYLKEDMPSDGIVCVFSPMTDNFSGKNKILIHKNTAEILLKEKAISTLNLIPACVVDKFPKGYTVIKTKSKPAPTNDYIKNCFKEYEKLIVKDRPEYQITEKEISKILRKTKSNRKSDFSKKLSNEQLECITNSNYKAMLPYYKICDGGLLSDEYRLLSYNNSLNTTKEFFKDLEKEELIKTKPCGIVIATCADGDFILLTKDEKVVRLSHESLDIIAEWKYLSNFFFEAMNDC